MDFQLHLDFRPLCLKSHRKPLDFPNADMLLATVLSKSFFALVAERPHDPLQFVMDALLKQGDNSLQNDESVASTSTELSTSSSLVAASNGVTSQAGNSRESSFARSTSSVESYYSVNADMLLADILSKALTIIDKERPRDPIQFVVDVLARTRARYLVMDEINGYSRNNESATEECDGNRTKKRRIKKSVTWAPAEELVKTVYIPRLKNTRKYIRKRKNKERNKENRGRVSMLMNDEAPRMDELQESNSSVSYYTLSDLDDLLVPFLSDALNAAGKKRPHDPIKFVVDFLVQSHDPST